MSVRGVRVSRAIARALTDLFSVGKTVCSTPKQCVPFQPLLSVTQSFSPEHGIFSKAAAHSILFLNPTSPGGLSH